MALCRQGSDMPEHTARIGFSAKHAASKVDGTDMFRPPCSEDQQSGSVQHGLQSIQKVHRGDGPDSSAIVDFADHQHMN